jgi:acetolactate synthase-1/2/3 large subunit
MLADAIVAADGGETASWMEMTAEPRGGGAGCRTATSAASAPAWPSRSRRRSRIPTTPVLCIVSDGFGGPQLRQFDTMVRHRLPIVTVVNNDQQWGMSAHGQELLYGKDRKVVTELAPTRYDLAAAGFGCHAEHVVEPRDLVPALERAFASGRPACVNVMTDPDVIAPITRMMVGATRQAEPAKERSAPLLRRPGFVSAGSELAACDDG